MGKEGARAPRLGKCYSILLIQYFGNVLESRYLRGYSFDNMLKPITPHLTLKKQRKSSMITDY